MKVSYLYKINKKMPYDLQMHGREQVSYFVKNKVWNMYRIMYKIKLINEDFKMFILYFY
jgi:hypothetical protein